MIHRTPRVAFLLMFPLSIIIMFSPACHFSRNNPNDIAGADYAGVSILRPGNGAQIAIDTLVVTWQGQGDVAEYDYRLDNGAWTSVGTGTSLVLRNLEEGDHFIEIRITNKKGKDSTAGVDFTVNALTGPSIFISPQVTRVVAADTAASVSVNLEGVDLVLGVNAVLVFDHTKVGFKKASSAWSFFKADTLGKDTLELSAACLDSVNGFSGNGKLVDLTFKLANVTGTSPADIVFLAGKSKLNTVGGGAIPFRNLRKGSISR